MAAHPVPALGLAVSGGGDSTALATLAADWAAGRGVRLAVLTIDHELRPEAGAEALHVARLCARLGLPHDIRHWSDERAPGREPGGAPGRAGQGWDGQGNLMQRARRMRYGLFRLWAAERGLPALALGHTMDDQAETLLMNLDRGSGVDGLSAMPEARREDGLLVLRPLLHVRRDALRDHLARLGEAWLEDPTNADPRFLRSRMRARMAGLRLDVPRLAETAARMQEIRHLVEALTAAAGRRHLRLEAGDILLSRALLDEPREIRDRVLRHVLQWVGNAPVRPRREAIGTLVGALRDNRSATLSGCRIVAGAEIRVSRELGRLAGRPVPAPGRWDNRWRITGPEDLLRGTEIRPLGDEGLAARPDWRAAGLPRASLLGLPGVWRGERLIFASCLDPDGPVRAEVDVSRLFPWGEAH